MKRSVNIVLLLCLSLAGTVMAQERDRRADLNVGCKPNLCVSSTGQLWLSTSCGMVYTAEVDNQTGTLWAVGDSGLLVSLTDSESVNRYDVMVYSIFGVVYGCVYCESKND